MTLATASQRAPSVGAEIPPVAGEAAGVAGQPRRAVTWPAPREVRTIWISDIHLGSPNCRAEALAEFLQGTESDHLYLVGDVFDLWCLGRRWTWRPEHARVLRAIAGKAANGTRVVYLPGNHDRELGWLAGSTLAGVEVRAEALHRTVDGLRLVLFHGDRLSPSHGRRSRLEAAGDRGYEALLRLDGHLNRVRRRLGLPRWSLPGVARRAIPAAAAYVRRFEQRARDEAGLRRADGVVCGHIHCPGLAVGIEPLYANTGDWVENCTALVEHGDGRMELVETAPAFPPCSLRKPSARPQVC